MGQKADGGWRPTQDGGPVGRSDANGFSLLEVLVATALVGLVLVVLLQVLTTNLRAQEVSWNYARALLVAEKIIQEHCEDGSGASIYQGREEGYDFLVNVAPQYQIPIPNNTGQLLCSVIQVTVSWRERERVKSVTLETARTSMQN